MHKPAPAARLYDVFAGQAVVIVDTLMPTLPPPGQAKPGEHCVSTASVGLVA